MGMSLSLARTEAPDPPPAFFSFVCTDERGKHFYVACLQFMEELRSVEVLALLHEVYGPDGVRTSDSCIPPIASCRHLLSLIDCIM